MLYRVATLEDCAVLTSLRMEMRAKRDPGFCKEDLIEITHAFFQRNIQNGSHVAFLCEHEGIVIATAGLSLFEMPPTGKQPNGKVGKLMNMYTVPQYRRQGVAKGMLGFVLAYAAQNNLGRIMLNASPMGKPLYEGFGFQLIPNEYGMNLQKQK